MFRLKSAKVNKVNFSKYSELSEIYVRNLKQNHSRSEGWKEAIDCDSAIYVETTFLLQGSQAHFESYSELLGKIAEKYRDFTW